MARVVTEAQCPENLIMYGTIPSQNSNTFSKIEIRLDDERSSTVTISIEQQSATPFSQGDNGESP